MTRVNVNDVLDDSPVRPFHILVVTLCGLVTLIDGYDLVVMGMAIPTMAQDWGVQPSVFAAALSSALVGVLFGSVIAGSCADRYGRRWTLVIMLLIASTFMLLTAGANTQSELIAYRFMTGFGAGGSIPLAIAFTSEYMPKRRRNMLVILMYAGAPMGSVFGAFVAPSLIANFGWQGIFVLGGILPIIVAVLIAFLLPESVRLLVARGCPGAVAAKLLKRVNPAMRFTDDQEFFVRKTQKTTKRTALSELFGGRQTTITLIVWIVFFGNQSIIYLFALWLPTLFTESGMALTLTLYIYALYKLGGAAGGVALGFISDKIEPARVLSVTYPLATILVAILGFTTFSVPLLAVTALFTGIFVGGSSLCLGSMTANLYPVSARATGVGWALGVGRLGSIISPLLGGAAIAAGWSLPVVLMVAALAPLTCAIGIIALTLLAPSRIVQIID
jgi:AAHS family 4-hydroxybenzoate transporter-like MFS transporter